MKTFLPVILILAAAGLNLSCASSTTLLKGDKGLDFIRTHDRLYPVNSFTYTDVRRAPGGKLQLAVLNTDEGRPDSGNFEWVRKEKSSDQSFAATEWNILLLDSRGGKRGKPLTKEILAELKESDLKSAVVLNKQRRMKAVVYYSTPLSLRAFVRPEGVVRLEFGQRKASQGGMSYTLTIFEKSSPEKKSREEKAARTVSSGDLVSWKVRGRTRAGVVKLIKSDGKAIINVPTTGGSREERAAVSDLTVLTPAKK